MFGPICALVLVLGETNAVTRAQALIEARQWREALGVLQEAQKQNTENTEVAYLRGYVLYRLGNLEQAYSQLEWVTRVAPPALRSRYFLGRIALDRGHPEEAVSWLKAPAEANPPTEDAPAQLCKAYLATHQLSEAQKWAEKAVAQAPWDGALHYRLARIYQEMGQREQAAQQFQASAELHWQNRAAVQDLVRSSKAAAGGDLVEARALKASLLKTQEADPDMLVALGTLFADAGKPDEALELFETAAKRDSSLFQARFDWGLALLKLGRAEEAVNPLRDCLRIAPASGDGNAALGLAYIMNNRFADAIAPLEAVRAGHPDDLRSGGLLSLAYARVGMPQKAVPLLRSILDRKQNDPKLYFLLLECLNSTDDQAGALSVAKETVQRFPELAKSHLAEGQQLACLGRYSEAGPAFARAVQLAPGMKEPLLGLAEVQNKSGDYDGSLATYRQVLAIDATDLSAQLGAARNLIATGQMAAAKDQLEKASAVHFDNPQIHVELSRVYARLGDRDNAEAQTKIVQRLRNAAQ